MSAAIKRNAGDYNSSRQRLLDDITIDAAINTTSREAPGINCKYIPPGDYRKEYYRTATFAKYPDDVPVAPVNLSKVGFYYTGYKDRVKCFSCGLSVENWIMGDNEFSPKWHKVDCLMPHGTDPMNIPIESVYPFLLKRFSHPQTVQHSQREHPFQQTRFGTIHDPAHERLLRSSNLKKKADRSMFSASEASGNIPMSEQARREAGEQDRIQMQLRPAQLYPLNRFSTLDMSSVQARIQNGWPGRTRASIEHITKAGFFYLGKNGKTKCSYCDGGLQNWERNNEPWMEHAKWFPGNAEEHSTSTINAPFNIDESGTSNYGAPSHHYGNQPFQHDEEDKATSRLKAAENNPIHEKGAGPEHEKQIDELQWQIEELQKRNEELENYKMKHRNVGSYKMDSSPVGLCVLINNVNFEKNRKKQDYNRRVELNKKIKNPLLLPRIDLIDRIGSNVDADKAEKLFECFNFIVKRHDDLDQRGIQKVIQEASLADHTNYDCFILIVLSHGDNGCVFGIDGFPVQVCNMQNSFLPNNCSSLADKPKIFIIQACQGGSEMPFFTQQPVEDVSHDGPPSGNILDRSTPSKADFLMAYSTVPGYKSYRSRKRGTHYMQEIVRIFEKNYKHHDLLSMMIMVNNEVTKYVQKQVPMPIPTLRNKVFFHLKEGCVLDLEDDGIEQSAVCARKHMGL